MEEQKKLEITTFMKLKNYIFLIIGIIYFLFYFSEKYQILLDFAKNINYGDIVLNIINSIIAFLTTLGIIGIFIVFLEKVLKKIALKTKNNIDDIFVEELLKYINANKIFFGIYAFMIFLGIPKDIFENINKFFSVIFIFILIYFINQLLKIIFEKIIIKEHKIKSINKSLVNFSKKVLLAIIWIIGIITILSNIGLNVNALVAGAGVGGVAIAFAAQRSIANIFGAINILLNKPFKIGDFISVNNITGTVKDLGLSYITLIEKNGHQVMIPNETITSSNIENFSVRESRRTIFSIGLIYGTTLENMKKAIKIVEEILENHMQNQEIKNYRVNFDMFGDFSLNIKVDYYSLINNSYKDYLKQKEEINLEIKKSFEKEKLEMAFPTQELILKNENLETKK